MKVVMIIGEPAVGKSTIMRAFMSRMGNWIFQQPKWVPHHIHAGNGKVVCVLGRYDDKSHQFPGTDRMSMACQQHALRFIADAQCAGWTAVVFEGDRLGNDKMIKSLQHMSVDLTVIHILTTQDRRRDSQSNAFRASRRTKIRNMTGPQGRCARSDQPIHLWVNDTPSDGDLLVNRLLEVVVGE